MASAGTTRASARSKELWRELTRLAPAPGSHWVALRAGTTVGSALLLLHVIDRVDLAPYACFGAFATLYGGGTASPSRWRLQSAVGLLLALSVTTGAVAGTSDARAVDVILLGTLWAGVGAWLSDRFGWRPGGPIFLVFSLGACGSIPTEWSTVPIAFVTAAATATFAVLVGVCELQLRMRVLDAEPAPFARSPVSTPTWRWLLTTRIMVAVAIAGSLTTYWGLLNPYWAMIAAVVPLAAPRFRHQFVRGVHRVVGTVVGLVLAGVLLSLHLPTIGVIVLVVVLQVVTEMIVARHYGLALVTITPLALLLVSLANPQPIGEVLLYRLVETAIGVVIGLGVGFLTRPTTK